MTRLSRRAALSALGAGAASTLAPVRLALAQAGPYRICMVLPGDERQTEVGFRDYLERRSIEIEYHRPTAEDTDDPQLAINREIRRLRPDLVYTWGTPTTLAVVGTFDSADPDRHITDLPVVFCTVTDPVGSRIVRELDRPGRNVTGVSHIPPLPVQINTMNAYRQVERLAVIYNSLETNSVLTVERLERLTAEMGMTLIAERVPLGADGRPDGSLIPDLVADVAARGAQFLYIGPDTFVAVTNRDVLTQAALDHRLPTFSATESIVRRSRALFGLFSSSLSVGRFCATKAEEILVDGRDPAEIPIETLRRFSLLINMPVALELEVYPPLDLLNLAEILTG